MTYHYIILGGGSAGCVLANRLTEDQATEVLLIEAGGGGRSPFVQMPAANGYVLGHPEFDWGYFTEPQSGLADRRIYWPRGRGLGGSSSINGMIYIRGNPRDYDGWRQLGLEGWAYADVLPYFRRSEGNFREDVFHRREGPLQTEPGRNFSSIDRIFLRAAAQAGIAPNPDFNGASQIGSGVYDTTVSGGRRWSAERAYLSRIKHRPNLTVLTRTFVQRLVFEGTRVVGVAITRRGGIEVVRCEAEIILALGAIGSPQTLLLSGVGPADHLRAHAIPVVADVPGVGSNLQDHLNVPVQYACIDPTLTFDRYQRIDRAAWIGLQYLLGRGGPVGAPFWSVGAFKALERGSEFPELQIFFTPMVLRQGPNGQRDAPASRLGDLLNAPARALFSRNEHALPGFQLDVNQMRSDSRGTLRLRSGDPRVHPVLEPSYLSSEKDRFEMIEAVKLAREIVSQSAFDPIRGEELAPGPSVRSDDEILDAVKRLAISGYHPVGTCKMGIESDPMGVVDADLRVRGVEGLRVVDASVMPVLVSGNTNGPTIMIAEKAADTIRGLPPLPRIDT